MTLPAITIRQPYAWLIAEGIKLTENRGQNLHHRGLIAIHAGKAWSPGAERSERVRTAWKTCHRTDLHAGSPELTYGAVIAVADLVDVHEATPTCCPEWGERFHHGAKRTVVATHLVFGDDVQKLDVPVGAVGQQMLTWPLRGDDEASVRAQLPTAVA